MFYLIDGDAIAERWRSLPQNWRDPQTGDIHTRVPVSHPRLRVGVQKPAPAIIPPFERLRRADGVYDPETDTVIEGWIIETVPLEQVRRLARNIVNAERDRRIGAGIDFVVGETTVRVETRNEGDFGNIAGLVQCAQMQVRDGDVGSTLTYRGANDTDVELTPGEAIDLGLAVATARSTAYRWAWAVKDCIAAAESLDAVVAILRAQGLLQV